MGLLGKFGDIILSNLNDLIDNSDDPGKMIKELILEMQEAVSDASASVAEASENLKSVERHLLVFKQQSEQFELKALHALQTGDEEYARKVLGKKAENDLTIAEEEKIFRFASATAEKLNSQLVLLKNKLIEAVAREQILHAQGRISESQSEMKGMLGELSKQSLENITVPGTEVETPIRLDLDADDAKKHHEIKEAEKKILVEDELNKLKEKLNKK
ncbi:MAG: PspA/IM30 family protein [Bacteroidota bacterium]